MDLKLLHLVRSRVTVSGKKGRLFEAYMLDLSQYAGARTKRGLDLIEFWKETSAEQLRRASLIFDTESAVHAEEKGVGVTDVAARHRFHFESHGARALHNWDFEGQPQLVEREERRNGTRPEDDSGCADRTRRARAPRVIRPDHSGKDRCAYGRAERYVCGA